MHFNYILRVVFQDGFTVLKEMIYNHIELTNYKFNLYNNKFKKTYICLKNGQLEWLNSYCSNYPIKILHKNFEIP